MGASSQLPGTCRHHVDGRGTGASARRCVGPLALVACLAAAGPSTAQPVAEFVSGRVYVIEDSGVATIPVILTGVTWSTVSVSFVTADGEGTADLDDYVGTGGFALWNRFENGIHEISFEVRVDTTVEPDETVFVDLRPANGGQYALGALTRCEVVIVDDDAGVQPFFEVPAPWRLSLDGSGYFLADVGESIDLTVRLSAPAPAGYEASYRIDAGPTLALPFTTGATSATITLGPPAEPASDEVYGVRSVELLDAPPVGSKGQYTRTFFGAWLNANAPGEPQQCLICGMLIALYAVSGQETCPDACDYEGWDTAIGCVPRKAANTANDIVVALRAYRDNLLAATENGQFYIALYRDLSPAMGRAAFRDMNLFFAMKDAADEWVPAFAALAEGNGAAVEVTPTMQAGLTTILDGLAASGDAAIIEAVQRERTRLTLDSITGLSLAQLQDRLETLGGGVPTRSEQWGGLKALYR